MKKRIPKLSKLEREMLRKVTSAAGLASADKLTDEERIARARKAGLASAKARSKKAGSR